MFCLKSFVLLPSLLEEQGPPLSQGLGICWLSPWTWVCHFRSTSGRNSGRPLLSLALSRDLDLLLESFLFSRDRDLERCLPFLSLLRLLRLSEPGLLFLLLTRPKLSVLRLLFLGLLGPGSACAPSSLAGAAVKARESSSWPGTLTPALALCRSFLALNEETALVGFWPRLMASALYWITMA